MPMIGSLAVPIEIRYLKAGDDDWRAPEFALYLGAPGIGTEDDGIFDDCWGTYTLSLKCNLTDVDLPLPEFSIPPNKVSSGANSLTKSESNI